ncbi:MAG: amidase [Rhodobacteraceae bacterium]|nr:amidase [Paracoccaceae bacterium]
MTVFWKKTIAELARDLADGHTTAALLTQQFLERIDKLNPLVNALITWNPGALAQAEASDARRKARQAIGPLDGIPLVVKDNILTAGIRTTWGSAVYEDYYPEEDETPVARLKNAGMVVLGKSNVPEFTLEGFTDNPLFGPTRNPWDLELTPGGSSGGSVAGVALGLFPSSIGTDGGGSIRRPCSYTGLFGLKPSIGRVPRAVTLPQVLFDLEVVGPITRDVTSSALLFAAMETADAADPRSCLPAELERDTPLETPPRELNILYVERMGPAPLDPTIAASCQEMAERLRAMGHSVTEGPLPLDLGALNEQWSLVGQAGLGFLEKQLGDRFVKASPKYRKMAASSRDTGSDVMFSVFDRIARLREDAAKLFERYDMILSPSAAAMPWPIGQDYPPEIDGESVGPRGHAVYTGWVNAIGHPGINLPAPPAPNGMPVGAHLIGGYNRDWLLLRLARQYEQAYPWHDQWPDLVEHD